MSKKVLKVDLNGKVNFDGNEIILGDKSTDFFENLIDLGLKNELEFDLPEESEDYNVTLFKKYEENLKEGSEFRTSIKAMETEIVKAQQELKKNAENE